MDSHKNARLTPRGRAEMVRAVVDGGATKAAAARKFNTTSKTVGKWVRRFWERGMDGLRDRSSRPLSSPSQTPAATQNTIEDLRRQRCTQFQIAAQVGVSPATVSRVLKRRGLSLLSALEPREPRPRYERATPGEIIHLDIKRLGRFNAVGHRITGDKSQRKANRGAGFEFVHVAIDDHSRVATAEIFPDEKKESAIAALLRAVAYFKTLGVIIDRVMTDNGSCYRSKAFVRVCHQLGIRQIFTKPYTPQTNGKAERFIQSALREWAYGIAFENSGQRHSALPAWLHRYNWHRPHASLDANTPISRLGFTRKNVLQLHIGFMNNRSSLPSPLTSLAPWSCHAAPGLPGATALAMLVRFISQILTSPPLFCHRISDLTSPVRPDAITREAPAGWRGLYRLSGFDFRGRFTPAPEGYSELI